MLRIVLIPNQLLNTPTKPVTKFDAALKKLLIDMEETLIACVDPQGVGLAATQVGKDISLFIMKPAPDNETKVIINPKILELNVNWPPKTKKKQKDEPLEGCLSIPRIWSPIKRAYKVYLEYQDINGNTHREWFKDFEAVIVQHEVDHLNGILFTKRAIEQDSRLYEEKDGELTEMETGL